MQSTRRPFLRLLSLTVLLSVWLLGGTGCATMADAQRGRGTGTSAQYKATFDEVWSALPNAIVGAGLEFVTANKEDRSALAQRGMTAFSYGENVAVFVDPVSASVQKVEVVSKKALATNVFAPNWAEPIFKELDKKFTRQ